MVDTTDQDRSQDSAPEIPFTAGDVTSPPIWARVAAIKEDRKWPELDEVKRNNDRRWLVVYGWVLVCVTVVFAAIFLSAFVAWSIHYLTPYTWLDEPQLNKIQSILFSGGMGAVVTSIVRSQISKAE